MMQQERPIGDVRRKSVDIGRFFNERLADDRYYKGDHWKCVESTALNEHLLRLCRSWRHSNAPIVTSRASLWPFVTRIETRGYDCEATFDFRPMDEINTNETSLMRLRDFLREFGSHSSYGRPLGVGFGRSRRDSVTSYDVSIRRSVEIRAAAPSIQTVLFDAELRKMMSRLLRTHWGMERTSIRFNKLSLYERGDRFEYHRDSVHGLAHIGTLEVALESRDLCGGNLTYRNFDFEPMRDCHYDDKDDQARDKVLKLSEYRARDMVKIHAFYTDIEHRIEPITEGYRVSIEYDIVKISDEDLSEETQFEQKLDDYSEYECIRTLFIEDGDDDRKSIIPKEEKDSDQEEHTKSFYNIFDEPEMSEKLALGIVELMNKAPRTAALMMSHLYPLAGVTRHLLRGYDKLLFDALEPYFDIEFMPVYLASCDDQCAGEEDIDMKCVSLQRRGSVDGSSSGRKKRKSHSLTLYVTPCAVHCAEKISDSYLDNFDGGGRFNYTTMAMILNKASSI